MKYWKCARCFREHETKDNVVMCICPACIIAMKRFPYAKQNKGEENVRNR